MLGYPCSRVFLEEARLPAAFRAAEKTQGALHDVRKYPGADPVVELGEIPLGEPLLGIEHTIGMGQGDSGYFPFASRPRLLRDHQDIFLPREGGPRVDPSGVNPLGVDPPGVDPMRSQLSRRPSRARLCIRTRTHRPESLRPLRMKLSFPSA